MGTCIYHSIMQAHSTMPWISPSNIHTYIANTVYLQQFPSSDSSRHEVYPLHIEEYDKHLVRLSQRYP